MARGGLRRLRRHRVPAWWTDAKLGIFVHWTPAAVPGWAPVDTDVGALLASGRPDAIGSTPYTEWYENSLRFPDSPVSRHHRDTHGATPYAQFAGEFEEALAGWDPGEWASTFAATGARYVVLVAKHHDGWCLWPTGVPNPRRAGWHARRDIVGELREAVLAAGLRFGLYYSGGLDWTFEDRPIGTFGDLVAAVPRGDYPAYAEAQVRELIDRYRPSVLWNDIAWPAAGHRLWPLMSHYYRAVPDGVLNDRWMPWMAPMAALRWGPLRRAADAAIARSPTSQEGLVPPRPPHFDVRTPEYTTFGDVVGVPWECVRGMDRSFGFNRNSGPEDFLSPGELLAMAADVVAKGGNLLLNVGPRGEDATIPAEQRGLLDVLGRWTAHNGAPAFGTRPWVRAAGRSPEGHDLRFWSSGRSVFAVVGPQPAEHARSAAGGGAGGTGRSGRVTLPGLRATPTTSVTDPAGAPVQFQDTPSGLVVQHRPPGDWPAIELRDVVATPLPG